MYFKDPTGGVHYLSTADIAAGGMALLPAGCVEITEAQAQATSNPPPTQAQIFASYESGVQANLDAVAQSWKYSDLATAASYANSTVAQYKSDATLLITWRDAVWQAAIALEAEITAGTTAAPATPAAFVALMPAAPAQTIIAA